MKIEFQNSIVKFQKDIQNQIILLKNIYNSQNKNGHDMIREIKVLF